MKIAKAIYESTGSELSLKKLAAQFDTTIETCRAYIEAFEAAYLILPCRFFTFSERKSALHPHKYYPIDLGLRRVISTRTGLDLGKKFETFIFYELRQRFKTVSFWKGAGEIDFVIETQDGIQPIQVTWSEPQKRHQNAFEDFKQQIPQTCELMLITRDNYETELAKLKEGR